MAFATHQYKQYVVEFIRGTGIRTNGLVNASNTGTTTPFTWTVPHDVVQLVVDGCSGGSGGAAGGQSSGSFQSGGGGGATGMQCLDVIVSVRPLSTLTITIGVGGLGGIAGTDVGFGGSTTQAGRTSISGLLPGTGTSTGTFHLSPPSVLNSTNGAGNSSTTTSVAGGVGGTTGVGLGTSPAAAITGQPTSINFSTGFLRGHSGGGGGGSASTSTSAGGQGGSGHQGNTIDCGLAESTTISPGTGNVLGGVISRGGGGGGASGLFGRGGAGGNGGANGSNSTGYGSAGGGGGGGADGGNGADGYVRFKFWSYE